MNVDSDGLQEIANTADSSQEADIVFVHGLGGGSHGTWRHGKKGQPGHFFWPEELGKDLPHCGIWTVGYPAGFTALGKPGMIIEKRAGNLSQKLANAGLGVRPLIFITHSMAGLIVKSLIVGSQILPDVDRKRLVGMIRGIVFCATPHRGSAFADAAGVLGKFFGGSQGHVEEMRANAEPLDILHDQFIEWHRSHPVPVESYAENIGLFRVRWWSRPLPLGLVVPRASANPGIAGHTVRDVDDDHLTLVKPHNRRHDVYAGVLRFIRDTLAEASSQIGKAPPTGPVPDSLTELAVETITVGRPRVYLSYTWRTRDLKQRVFELAEKLRENAIDSRMDLYYAKSLHGFTPPDPLPDRDSWEAWQEDEIRNADRVLVVCSKEYTESPENSGAWRDLNFMKKNLESGGATLRKFIPVGFGPYELESQFIPSFIRGATYYDLTPGASVEFGFEDLVRRFRTEFFADSPVAPSLLNDGKSQASKERHAPVQPDASSQVMSEITVFISYSHDSDTHRERVLGLSERLRRDGITTILDRYVEKGSPPEGWPRWMMNGLNAATQILCVCTETYYRRFRGQEVPGKGKGADWEGALITQALYDARSSTNKFVPVLFADSEDPHPGTASRADLLRSRFRG
jgi:hypothetical protein